MVAVACGAAAVAWAPAARAQQEDQAAARALFAEGRRLATAGDYAQACPKFEAASHLYPSAGVLLSLADCYEKTGRTASAWAEYQEAITLAERVGRDAAAVDARQRLTSLEPRVPHLSLHVSHPIAGLKIARDGVDLAPGAWDQPIPIDPGRHRVEATAAGFDGWSTWVELSPNGQTVTVDVPELRSSTSSAGTAPPPAAPSPSGAASPSPEPTQAAPGLATTAAPESTPPSPGTHVAGWVTLAAGVVVAGGGAALMAVEAGRASDSRSAGNTDGSSEYSSTKVPWTIGLAGAVAGGVAAVAGVVLLVLPAGHPTHAGDPQLTVGVGPATLRAGVSW